MAGSFLRGQTHKFNLALGNIDRYRSIDLLPFSSMLCSVKYGLSDTKPNKNELF